MRETTLQDQLRRVKEAMVGHSPLHSDFGSDVFQDRNAFIITLIDGDGMIFTKEFLSKGEKGGKEAATALSNALIEFASDNLGHLDSPRILTRIYANFSTLSESLIRNKIIDKASTFDEFVRGFNSTKLLFDFVDAGSKKDAAGDKLSEMLRLQLYDCHCHQILLGCSHNSEYVHILEDIRNNQEVGNHVTLLEGIPFEKDLAALQPHFRTIKFDGIFQSVRLGPATHLPKAPPAVAAPLPALTRVESNKTNGSTSSAGTPQMNWATVTAQAQLHATPTPAVKPTLIRTSTPSSSTTAEPTKPKPKTSNLNKSIDKNRHGMRIDRVDAAIPNYEIQRVKKLKLCNIYYLQGADLCTSNNCSHRHDYPISNYERKILREVARMTPCYYKTDCDDADCIYGHRCPQSKPDAQGCYYGEDCRFYGWGHGIDTRVCKTIKV
jgi:hypothetical protein